jgi:hypothetical protein
MDGPRDIDVKKAGSPHDDFFFEVFREPQRAAVFFRHFLPVAMVQALDFDAALLKESSFKKVLGKNRYADLLYSIPFKEPAYNQDRLTPYLYVLWEHQSSADAMLGYRFLSYILSKWESLIKEQEEEENKDKKVKKERVKLPMILPLCFYHGAAGWHQSLDVFDLIDLPGPLQELFRPYAPAYVICLFKRAPWTTKPLMPSRMSWCVWPLSFSRPSGIKICTKTSCPMNGIGASWGSKREGEIGL